MDAPIPAPLPVLSPEMMSILDHVIDVVYLLDREWRFIYLNAAAANGFGRSAESLLGKSLWEEFPQMVDTAFYRHSHRALSEGTAVVADGYDPITNFWVHLQLLPMTDGLSVISHDFTCQHEALQRQKSALARQQQLVRDCEAVLAETTSAGVMQQVVDAARAVTGARLGAVLHEDSDGVVHLDAVSFADDIAACRSMTTMQIRHDGVYMAAIRQRQSLRFTDAEIRAHPDRWALPEGHIPVRGLLGARLLDRDRQSIGAVLLTDKSDGEDFTEEDEALLVQLTSLASLALQHIAIAKETDQAKDEFLAVLSHELQTPLTSMLGWSEIALEHNTLEAYRRSMPIVHRNARRQQRLIDELLDMSKLQHRRLEWRPEPIDLGALAYAAAEEAMTTAENVGLALLPDPIPCDLPVYADPAHLRSCLDHLLSNSLKYTPAGGRITVSCRKEGDDAVLTVTDTGRGLTPDVLPLLFLPFRQVDRDETAGGLGLGLAIVRGIAELCGGTVTAESPGVGQGSTFTLHLPLYHADETVTEYRR